MIEPGEGRQQKELERPFPQEHLDNVRKGNRNLTYVPVHEVVQRLNDTLGDGGWDWDVERIWRDQTDPDWVIAYGKLTATVDGVKSTKSGAGGVLVSRKQSDGSIVDLGDEFKGADSDAMKKAAQRFGVGLYLSRDPEAIAYERPAEPPPPPKSATEMGWQSEERAKQHMAELRRKKSAASEEVQRRISDYQAQNDIAWPPTADGWAQLNGELERLLKAEKEDLERKRESYDGDTDGMPPPSDFDAVNHTETLPVPPEGKNDVSMPMSRSDEQALAEAGIPPEDLPPQSPESDETASEPQPSTDTADSATGEESASAADKLAAAFPGSKDVSPAHPDLVGIVEAYLNRLRENDDKASLRAWSKYRKEKGYPEKLAELTTEQANEAADFLETL